MKLHLLLDFDGYLPVFTHIGLQKESSEAPNHAEQFDTDAGVRAVSKDDGSHELDFTRPNRAVSTVYYRLPAVVKLELIQDNDLKNLNLEGFAHLQSLKIYNNGRLTAIAGLESLQNLREVALDERFIVTSIDKLSNLNQLQRLKLKNSHSFS